MALDPEQYLRTVQREYLDFIDDDVSWTRFSIYFGIRNYLYFVLRIYK